MSCHIHPQLIRAGNFQHIIITNQELLFIVPNVIFLLKVMVIFLQKPKHGLKDVYGYFFKDSAKIDWEKKKLLENAKGFVYEKSCKDCHQNLFPVTLSVNGGNAHLFYTTSKDPLNCINCHL